MFSLLSNTGGRSNFGTKRIYRVMGHINSFLVLLMVHKSNFQKKRIMVFFVVVFFPLLKFDNGFTKCCLTDLTNLVVIPSQKLTFKKFAQKYLVFRKSRTLYFL